MTKNLSMEIDGMTCGHCLQAVRRALEAVPGVAVNAVTIGAADVSFDEALVTADQVKDAVFDEGYAVVSAK